MHAPWGCATELGCINPTAVPRNQFVKTNQHRSAAFESTVQCVSGEISGCGNEASPSGTHFKHSLQSLNCRAANAVVFGVPLALNNGQTIGVLRKTGDAGGVAFLGGPTEQARVSETHHILLGIDRRHV